MIRTSSHSTKFTNKKKLALYTEFLSVYRDAVSFYVDYLWSTKVECGNYVCDIKNRKYSLPSMLSTVGIELPEPLTVLSARALKCAINQAGAIIKAVIDPFAKKAYSVKKNQKKQTPAIRKVQSWLDRHTPTKPTVGKINPELNSICATFLPVSNEFDGFLILSSLGKRFGKIAIPIKFTSRSNYWKVEKSGKMMSSFLLSRNKIDIRWDIPVDKNKNDLVVGGDIGQSTVLTLSDGRATKPCIHGHDLKSINNKMARKKKGSLAFKKACDHRTNYVNWSVKQLGIEDIKELRLESNKGIKFKRNTSKSLRHWSWSDINLSVSRLAEEYDVHINYQSAPYKSQRCSACGYTHKRNRHSKLFRCVHCGFTCDADMNGAMNNSIDLPVITKAFRLSRPNLKGFFWTKDGIGPELTVPVVKNSRKKSASSAKDIM